MHEAYNKLLIESNKTNKFDLIQLLMKDEVQSIIMETLH
jgi:hypothetical protein